MIRTIFRILTFAGSCFLAWEMYVLWIGMGAQFRALLERVR